MANALPNKAWRSISAGAGSKGARWYDWVLTPLFRLQPTEEEQHYGHYLLIRRHRKKPDEQAYYVVFAPREKASLETLVQVAGQRWQIEQGFQMTKGECGLEHYEVRQWRGWYRHITLSLLAHALLVVIRQSAQKTSKGESPGHFTKSEVYPRGYIVKPEVKILHKNCWDINPPL